MRGSALFILCFLFVLLAISTDAEKGQQKPYYHPPDPYKYRVYRQSYEMSKRSPNEDSLRNHLNYIHDTAGSDVNNEIAKKLQLKKNKGRVRYN